MTKIRIVKTIVIIAALLLAALAGFAVARADGLDNAPRIASFGPESSSTAWLGVLALLAVIVAAVIAWLSSRDNETW